MYISYKWLQDFVNLPTKINYSEVADKLTAHTVEIESFYNQADVFNNVVVGKVLEVKEHPNADKLRVATVDVKGKELNIVCGAPNIAAEQLVPVALDGAVLPGGMEIKTAKIRGEVSEGMVCAEDELGLGVEHDGIMVLDKKAKIGEDLASYMKTNDVIFEVDNKSLSNRPDLLNHYGLARELAVIFSKPLKPYSEVIDKKLNIDDIKKDKVNVDILDKKKCPRYMALKIDNIKIEPSPEWLKNRLVAINQKPINNIVDLANYVMFDCGQPLHTFDGSKVKKIVVKNADNHQTIETLDGKERKLTSDDLIISDGKEVLAIAGVIGSQDSQINSNSTSLILESANFTPSSIRKTSQRLNIRTEASLRYEKSLDPNLTKDALHRFTSLLLEMYKDARIVSSVTDVYSEKLEEKKINLNLSWLYKKIGQEIPQEDVFDYLNRLGFIIEKKEDEIIELIVPSWRATKDIETKEDVVEEVLRIYGYDNIKSTLPVEEMSLIHENKERELERKVKDMLYLRFDLTEVHNYSFVGEEQLKKLSIDFFNHLKLINPLSELNSMLRQSLAPGLFYNIKSNQTKSDSLAFFEIGNTFFNAPGGYDKGDGSKDKLPYQEKRLGIVFASKGTGSFSKIKDICTNMIKDVLGEDQEVNYSNFENHPGWSDEKKVAKIIVQDEDLGWISLLSKESAQNLNLKLEASLLEINFNKLSEIYNSKPAFRIEDTAKYPPVVRDISFVVFDKVVYNDIKDVLSSFDSLIKKFELFDVYSGDKLEKNEKSLAFHLTYQATDRTLTAAEVDKVQGALVKEMKERFGARLRNF